MAVSFWTPFSTVQWSLSFGLLSLKIVENISITRGFVFGLKD